MTVPDDVYLEMVEALRFYADPDTYFSIAMVAEEVCGVFETDFGPVAHPYAHYDREMPGLRAREVLAGLGKVVSE